MSRFAKRRRVIYWEEPIAALGDEPPHLDLHPCPETGVLVARPVLPEGLDEAAREAALRILLD